MKPDRQPDSLCGTWQDSEADRLMREEELEAEEKLKGELAQAGAAAAEDLKSQLAARMKDKGDAFDTMIQSEEKIRLGEEGWKARYYQVACPFDRLCLYGLCHHIFSRVLSSGVRPLDYAHPSQQMFAVCTLLSSRRSEDRAAWGRRLMPSIPTSVKRTVWRRRLMP